MTRAKDRMIDVTPEANPTKTEQIDITYDNEEAV